MQVRLIRKNSSTTFFVKKESRLRLFNHEIRTQIPFHVCTKIVVQLQMSGALLSQMQKSTFWKKEKISSDYHDYHLGGYSVEDFFSSKK